MFILNRFLNIDTFIFTKFETIIRRLDIKILFVIPSRFFNDARLLITYHHQAGLGWTCLAPFTLSLCLLYHHTWGRSCWWNLSHDWRLHIWTWRSWWSWRFHKRRSNSRFLNWWRIGIVRSLFVIFEKSCLNLSHGKFSSPFFLIDISLWRFTAFKERTDFLCFFLTVLSISIFGLKSILFFFFKFIFISLVRFIIAWLNRFHIGLLINLINIFVNNFVIRLRSLPIFLFVFAARATPAFILFRFMFIFLLLFAYVRGIVPGRSDRATLGILPVSEPISLFIFLLMLFILFLLPFVGGLGASAAGRGLHLHSLITNIIRQNQMYINSHFIYLLYQ